jgi:hypothetical protein
LYVVLDELLNMGYNVTFWRNRKSKGGHALLKQPFPFFNLLDTKLLKVRNLNSKFFTYTSLKSIVLEPVIPITRRSILNSSLRTAACTKKRKKEVINK